MDEVTLLTKEEEDRLLQCSNFHELLDRALFILEQDDYYAIAEPLRDVHNAVHKLVTTARAAIYSRRLRAISERLDTHDTP